MNPDRWTRVITLKGRPVVVWPTNMGLPEQREAIDATYDNPSACVWLARSKITAPGAINHWASRTETHNEPITLFENKLMWRWTSSNGLPTAAELEQGLTELAENRIAVCTFLRVEPPATVSASWLDADQQMKMTTGNLVALPSNPAAKPPKKPKSRRPKVLIMLDEEMSHEAPAIALGCFIHGIDGVSTDDIIQVQWSGTGKWGLNVEVTTHQAANRIRKGIREMDQEGLINARAYIIHR